jgi:hypothetical protein
LLLSETNQHRVGAASSGGTGHARREWRHLPRRGRSQIPQTGFSALCHCQYRHDEKTTDQRDPNSSPAHDSCCLAEQKLILAYALYVCEATMLKGNSHLRPQGALLCSLPPLSESIGISHAPPERIIERGLNELVSEEFKPGDSKILTYLC